MVSGYELLKCQTVGMSGLGRIQKGCPPKFESDCPMQADLQICKIGQDVLIWTHDPHDLCARKEPRCPVVNRSDHETERDQ
jgi:hypothetical protein